MKLLFAAITAAATMASAPSAFATTYDLFASFRSRTTGDDYTATSTFTFPSVTPLSITLTNTDTAAGLTFDQSTSTSFSELHADSAAGSVLTIFFASALSNSFDPVSEITTSLVASDASLLTIPTTGTFTQSLAGGATPLTTPLPNTVLLCSTGLGLLGLMVYWRKRGM